MLVTGAAGFVGSHLLDALAALGLPTEAWARPETPPPFAVAAGPCSWREVELLDPQAVVEAVRALRPRTIFHLAGAAHVGQSWGSAATTLQINVMATHHLLEADRELGLGARMLIPGSATVYRPTTEPLTEEHEVGPSSPYAVSKLAQEQLGVRAAAEGQNVVVTRSFNHIGPRQASSFAAASFARQIALIEAGRLAPVLRVGNLEARRDLTDVRDTVRAYLQLAAAGHSGRVYNVCSGRAVSMQDVLDGLRERSAVAVNVERDPALQRPADAPVLVGSFERLRKDTGWVPALPLDRTLDDLLAFWRQAISDPATA